ncbi:UBX domain-containing protein 8 [Lingula anatina]|uniref:UBX domain-containing protein 8 n=1 Tax=Lingula anatina TaxID=7574 RepID=A0A1S3INC3_LINAN|nr:UBX domain-containing protein 8 [Lingula anatina]|eukprot:XP_013399573.1 UBX domain-containing protein 8 [Lingula anatina]
MAGKDWFLLAAVLGLSAIVYTLDYDPYQLLSLLVLSGLRFLIISVALSGVLYICWKYLKGFLESKTKVADILPTEEQKYKEKEKETRQKIQEDYAEKASEYRKNVLQPKEEAKRQKLEEQYYRFAGPAWKGKGTPLGYGEEGNGASKHKANGKTGKDAAKARKLPEHHNQSVMQEKPKQRKIITLPEEPSPGTPDTVFLSFRTPLGKIHRRRFMHSDKIQVLLDYITKLGYHQTIYTISTTYPRVTLSDQADYTLKDQGLTVDMMLNLELKDPDILQD